MHMQIHLAGRPLADAANRISTTKGNGYVMDMSLKSPNRSVTMSPLKHSGLHCRYMTG